MLAHAAVPWPAAALVQALARSLACSLHQPGIALLLSGSGLLLLILEFHRPGKVLPGAIGLGLILLGIHAFSLQPLRVWAVLLLLAASVLLCSPWVLPQRSELGPMGTAALSTALVFLPRSAGGRWVWLASSAGLLLGAVCCALTTIAGKARRAKRRHRPGAAAQELWE